MTTLPPTLPLTIVGRSPFDSIRLRWGGLSTLALGIGIPFTGEPAAIVLGILLITLGLATIILSAFGAKYWYDIPTPQRYIVGTGAIIGFLTFIVFIGGTYLTARIIQAFAQGSR